MNLNDVYQETRRTIAMAINDGYNTTEIVESISRAIKDAKKDDGKFKGLVDIFADAKEATKMKKEVEDDGSFQRLADFIMGEKK